MHLLRCYGTRLSWRPCSRFRHSEGTIGTRGVLAIGWVAMESSHSAGAHLNLTSQCEANASFTCVCEEFM